MKIGIVCYPTFGGSGVVATELGKSLASIGHQVHFITYEQPTRLDFLSTGLHYHKVDIQTYPLFKYPPYELVLASKMVNVVRSEQLDVLHLHYAIPHASAAYMAKQILREEGIHIPTVTTLHGTDITLVGKEENFAPVVTFSINQSDVVTAVSESLRRQTFDLFDKVHHEILVIPNFIDLNRFTRQKKEHFKKAICPENEKLIVHASNFRKVKRVDDVVKVFAQIRKAMPAKLLLIGDGPERRSIERLCQETQICQDVRFLGETDAIEEVLSVADLFVMPSEKESFGLAALEAMACEVPVVASNVGGLPELIEQGLSGFMSHVGDVDDMAKNAIHILQEQNLVKFKKQALERAKNFEISKIVPLYEQAYEEAIQKNMIIR
ncbi:MAG: N-acetyl-alpha-D-glucosaminyl L-malate synthase BshA [Bernardetiaceae bacterium]|nr:N-acetyl-alpha-D-glucosaminyl L-malate synthase BshA [Bernardetiaceae bacterium]